MLRSILYINNMGGIKSKTCDSSAKDIWSFAIDIGCWLSSVHIPGIDNTTADFKSKKFAENTEWQLILDIFELTMSALQFYPDVGLFASRTNHQINTYVSWHPNPHAMATYAFTLSWTHLKSYAFPPFSIIGRVVAKIVKDQATGAVPNWSIQYWYPSLLSIKISEMIYLPEYALRLQSDQMKQHPLQGKLRLMAVFRSKLEKMELPELTQDIILASWREGTHSRYKSFWNRWQKFCVRKNISVSIASVKSVLEFFTELYADGCRYSTGCLKRIVRRLIKS